MALEYSRVKGQVQLKRWCWIFIKFGLHTRNVHIGLLKDIIIIVTASATLIAYIFIEGSVFNLLIVCFQLHLVPCRPSQQLYILLKFHAIEFPLWRLQIAILGPDTLNSLCHLSLSWQLTSNNSHYYSWRKADWRRSLALFALDIIIIPDKTGKQEGLQIWINSGLRLWGSEPLLIWIIHDILFVLLISKRIQFEGRWKGGSQTAFYFLSPIALF